MAVAVVVSGSRPGRMLERNEAMDRAAGVASGEVGGVGVEADARYTLAKTSCSARSATTRSALLTAGRRIAEYWPGWPWANPR